MLGKTFFVSIGYIRIGFRGPVEVSIMHDETPFCPLPLEMTQNQKYKYKYYLKLKLINKLTQKNI